MNPTDRQRLIYVCSDFGATLIAIILYYIIRNCIMPSASGVDTYTYLHFRGVQEGIISFSLIMLGIYWLSGYYRSVFIRSRLSDFLSTFFVSFVGTIFYFFVILAGKLTQSISFNFWHLVIFFCIYFLSLYTERFIVQYILKRSIAAGKITFPGLILGTSKEAAQIANGLKAEQQRRGIRIIGFISLPGQRISDEVISMGLTNFPFDELGHVVADYKIMEIVFSPEGLDQKTRSFIVGKLYALNLPVLVNEANLSELTRRSLGDIKGEPLVNISHPMMSDSTACIKRAFDVVVSFVSLLILMPFLLLVGLVVKLDSKGPILYKQMRLGYRRKPFKIYKFRSMQVDSEPTGIPQLTSEDDNRITRSGKIMRKYRIDELPQLWNVLKGDMSLVGPRPEREYFANQIIAEDPAYFRIYRVRPGITSWGMVKYGYVNTISGMLSRMKYDLIYLDNITLSVDLKIILHTISTVISGKGQ